LSDSNSISANAPFSPFIAKLGNQSLHFVPETSAVSVFGNIEREGGREREREREMQV